MYVYYTVYTYKARERHIDVDTYAYHEEAKELPIIEMSQSAIAEGHLVLNRPNTQPGTMCLVTKGQPGNHLGTSQSLRPVRGQSPCFGNQLYQLEGIYTRDSEA